MIAKPKMSENIGFLKRHSNESKKTPCFSISELFCKPKFEERINLLGKFKLYKASNCGKL